MRDGVKSLVPRSCWFVSFVQIEDKEFLDLQQANLTIALGGSIFIDENTLLLCLLLFYGIFTNTDDTLASLVEVGYFTTREIANTIYLAGSSIGRSSLKALRAPEKQRWPSQSIVQRV